MQSLRGSGMDMGMDTIRNINIACYAELSMLRMSSRSPSCSSVESRSLWCASGVTGCS
ncbi:predicted protein [Chaetomium globosum CBS 148.51]|uniref:Uncharacterized protein n=1 Tax=Chaetomium globosum (strain ATCC 6205 / CBS 148.51 / DSM 1962 / NBRC 6347 / NRRL 1970) TaxID=306901 RepID=Q2GNV4_CHAGB|nr:uncharacterized protein CHGG_10350 [Chaetomium globosum CBS 148.51]EAQ83946.1 predicted protein [Chaetomium globosum CBS 148.51]